MKTAFSLVAAGLLLGGLAFLPTASAGCTLAQTCAWVVGGSGCSFPSGECSGSWSGLHSAVGGGTGYVYVDGDLRDSRTLTVKDLFRCTTSASLEWNALTECHQISVKTESSTGEEAWDFLDTLGCW